MERTCPASSPWRPLPVWDGGEAAGLAPRPFPLPDLRRIVTLHMNNLGDLLFTLPALAALRRAFPRAHVVCVVRAPLAPLLRDSALVNEVLVRPVKGGGPAAHAGLMRQVRRARADLVVAFSQSLPMLLLAGASGAPVRMGFEAARLGQLLLTRRVSRPAGPATIQAHLALVRAITNETGPCSPEYRGLLRIAPDVTQAADRLLVAGGIAPGAPFVIAACEAGTKRAVKEWPNEHWRAALGELARRRPIVLVGARRAGGDRADDFAGNIADLRGRTDLATLAALCARARLLLGSDSGVLHLAAAVGTPVVGIFGPTDWRRTGPRGVPARIVVRHDGYGDALPCAPCFRSRCRWAETPALARRCLTDITPRVVVDAANELLGS